MAIDERNRGMFGYEGEGFLREPRRPQGSAERGWNIGYDSDRPSYRGRGPKNYQRSDERIREDVCERLTMDHDVDASDVEVNVADGVVTLSGSVSDRRAKRLAEDLCESVRGVKDVQNDLRVTR
ncbi:MAG TPA: BON domain-containing protein [Thermoanaerobaculia bacterium]|nr:BON domain-containing protein [Thermoanaerobaculia bacterium]